MVLRVVAVVPMITDICKKIEESLYIYFIFHECMCYPGTQYRADIDIQYMT